MISYVYIARGYLHYSYISLQSSTPTATDHRPTSPPAPALLATACHTQLNALQMKQAACRCRAGTATSAVILLYLLIIINSSATAAVVVVASSSSSAQRAGSGGGGDSNAAASQGWAQRRATTSSRRLLRPAGAAAMATNTFDVKGHRKTATTTTKPGVEFNGSTKSAPTSRYNPRQN